MLKSDRDTGKIRHIGYSGDNEYLAWAVKCPLIDVVEASVNVVDYNNVAFALKDAAHNGVAVMVKQPIANAVWLHADNPDQAKEHHQCYARRFQHMGLYPSDYDCDNMAELALRFTISLEDVSCAIVSCTSPAHPEANLTAVTTGALRKQAMDRRSAAFASCQLASAGSWLVCN